MRAADLDAVVNNAGIMDENDASRTLAVNLDGVHAVTAAFAPLLGAGGRVINVSSGAGLRAAAALAPADREALEADTVADIKPRRPTGGGRRRRARHAGLRHLQGRGQRLH